MEHEYIAEDEAREQETTKQRMNPQGDPWRRLSRDFAELNMRLDEFENMGPNTRMFSLTERDVYGALSAYKQPMMKEKEMNQMVLK